MTRPSAIYSRLPTRVRVTLVFTAVMALLLTAAGLFLYVRLGATLNQTMDRGLRSRAGDVSALISQADSGLAQAGRSPLTQQGESLAQILDRQGRVVDAPPPLRARALLSRRELARAEQRTILVEHSSSPLEGDQVRLLATPVRAQGRRLLVVVGASLDATKEAQRGFGGLLLVGGPIALLIAALAGYGAAAGALRPVESMRRRAREIQASRPGRRLPVPPSNDEVTRLGETLNEMLERLEVAFARERQFVSDASHELRTPLAILKGELELELALRDATDVADFRRSVTSAAEEADRLTQLAEDLLVIARSDQGRLPVRLDTVDAHDLLDTVSVRFSRRATEHGVALTVDPPGDLRLRADRLRLEQALGNLVDNALRHGAGAIELAAVRRADRVELHVRDRGAGFPPAFLEAAFERFTRGDTARGHGGAVWGWGSSRPSPGRTAAVQSRAIRIPAEQTCGWSFRLSRDAGPPPEVGVSPAAGGAHGDLICLRQPASTDPPPDKDGDGDEMTLAGLAVITAVLTGAGALLSLLCAAARDGGRGR